MQLFTISAFPSGGVVVWWCSGLDQVLLSGGSGVQVPLGVPCDGLVSCPGCVPSPSSLMPSVTGLGSVTLFETSSSDDVCIPFLDTRNTGHYKMLQKQEGCATRGSQSHECCSGLGMHITVISSVVIKLKLLKRCGQHILSVYIYILSPYTD
uniref:Uncharacterized protein n=1 Tax=Scleropages formosus TaxID=113540 RepID=A0A8D0CIN1_SCLFO